jgi:hypothetical protein
MSQTDVIDAEHREIEPEKSAAIVPIAKAAEQIAAWTPSFSVAVDEAIERKKEKRRFFQEVMDEDLHYGKIPGTGSKPTLLKPGAEMLLSNMGLNKALVDASPPVIDYDGTGAGNGEPLIRFHKICRIYRQTGLLEHQRMLVAESEGSCSSRETKYRWRESKRKCPSCGGEFIIKGKQEYGGGWLCFKKQGGCGSKFNDGDAAIEAQQVGRIPNPDVADVENTILKMAEKRALVGATLLATGCSDIFTQDVEDGDPGAAEAPQNSNAAAPKTTRAAEVKAAVQARRPAPPVAQEPPADDRRAQLIKDIHVLCQTRDVSRPLYLSTLSEQFGDDRWPEKKDGTREPTSKVLSVDELQQVYQVLSERTAAEANANG